jgi:hypothetical protein
MYTPQICTHFLNVGEIRLCDYFVFPDQIDCTYGSHNWIAHTKDCVVVGDKEGWSTNRKDLGLKPNTSLVAKPDFSKVACIAGAIAYTYKPTDLIEHIFHHTTFQDKYMQYYYFAMDILNYEYSPSNYVVVHWRRGDQLHERCTNSIQMLQYHCYNVTNFIDFVSNTLQLQNITTKNIYIATNERNHQILNILTIKGYKTIQDLLLYMGLHENSIDYFIIELIMMCNSYAFISGGPTSVRHVVKICRKSNLLNHTLIEFN